MDLPSEIWLLITDNLTKLLDLGSLALANKSVNDKVSPILYRNCVRQCPDVLLWACNRGLKRTVRQLLDAGADPQLQPVAHCSTDEFFMCNDEFPNAIKIFGNKLLKTRLDCVRNVQALTEAIQERDDLDIVSWSAIHVAVARGHIDVVKMLLQHEQGSDLIDCLASGYCTVDALQLEPRQFGRPGRQISELRRSSRPTGMFLDHPPRQTLEHTEWTLHTPLRAALFARQEDAALLLIERKASLKFGPGPNGEFDHALHIAARFGCLRVVEHICSQGLQTGELDMNMHDSDGWTPLCHAIASRSDADGLALLLDFGADVNAPIPVSSFSETRVEDGFTHLHLACWMREWIRAEQLLKNGADPHAIFTPSHSIYSSLDYQTRNIGPFRAIDIICTSTVCNSRLTTAKTHKTSKASQVTLLEALIKVHHVDLGPCPSSRGYSPLSLLASASFADPWEHILDLFWNNGVDFAGDLNVLEQAITMDSPLHLMDAKYQPRVVEVVERLFKYGAQLHMNTNTAKDSLFAAVEGFLKRGVNQYHLDVVELLTLLLGKGGMDPNLSNYNTARDLGFSEDSKNLLGIFFLQRPNAHSLMSYQHFSLPLRDTHQEIFDVLLEYGARPPTVLQILPAFLKHLPEMKAGEAGRPFHDWEQWAREGDEEYSRVPRAPLPHIQKSWPREDFEKEGKVPYPRDSRNDRLQFIKMDRQKRERQRRAATKEGRETYQFTDYDEDPDPTEGMSSVSPGSTHEGDVCVEQMEWVITFLGRFARLGPTVMKVPSEAELKEGLFGAVEAEDRLHADFLFVRSEPVTLILKLLNHWSEEQVGTLRFRYHCEKLIFLLRRARYFRDPDTMRLDKLFEEEQVASEDEYLPAALKRSHGAVSRPEKRARIMH